MPRALAGTELVDALLAPVEPELVELAGGVVVLDDRAGALADVPAEAMARAVERLATLPCVVLAAPGSGAGPSAGSLASPEVRRLVDATPADDAALVAMVATAEAAPTAASALALHLRGSDGRAAGAGLIAESALYSALQAGPEHQAWRAATPVHPPRAGDGAPRVRAERRGDELRVTLTRPAARNALDVRMRDELLDALAVAVAAPELQVVVDGEGEAFCAGGDLDEFGTRPDVSTAHLVRLRRSLGAVLLALAPRTTVLVHGPSAGSGVELAAFAGRVVAQPDATFLLPELRMGLVPGAGGTVSLPRRIGRHATMGLCLAAGPIDAAAAVALGLVDEIRA